MGHPQLTMVCNTSSWSNDLDDLGLYTLFWGHLQMGVQTETDGENGDYHHP